jgi:hypothetical protein
MGDDQTASRARPAGPGPAASRRALEVPHLQRQHDRPQGCETGQVHLTSHRGLHTMDANWAATRTHHGKKSSGVNQHAYNHRQFG